MISGKPPDFKKGELVILNSQLITGGSGTTAEVIDLKIDTDFPAGYWYLLKMKDKLSWIPENIIYKASKEKQALHKLKQ